ncbi:MAG: Uma2 family endonuclease [Leptolyngbyaceae cyanobacterium RU_5_1]|nr:Uma2 family endonuclease [Leptolyngbyaceae cyanobacterium RU_5_1]
MANDQYLVEQTDPPRPPAETLPTMYDLPSESPEEPGLPDEFHDLQPQLLSATFRLQDSLTDQIYTASDLNLYYDVRHPRWCKRPDWFAVVGVSRLYRQQDIRLSYVIWQEGVNPFVVVELLSPGTEKEDLGQTERGSDQPPTKWEVYEQVLRVPYYVIFDRYTNQLRAFGLNNAHYRELDLPDQRIWMSELNLGLGLWHGMYQGIERYWLRWYDSQGNWVPTETEAERDRAERAEARAEALAQRLRELGVNPDELAF